MIKWRNVILAISLGDNLGCPLSEETRGLQFDRAERKYVTKSIFSWNCEVKRVGKALS